MARSNLLTGEVCKMKKKQNVANMHVFVQSLRRWEAVYGGHHPKTGQGSCCSCSEVVYSGLLCYVVVKMAPNTLKNSHMDIAFS